jgi:hypothetical protein
MRFIFWMVFGLSTIPTTAWADTPPSGAPPYLSVYVAILTGLFGFVGSWMGAHIALFNFKKQRAFDKQLDWYERAVSAIHSMAEKIQIASTFEDDRVPPPPELLEKLWRDVQSAHLALDKVSRESYLYASARAKDQMVKVAKKVQEIANKSEAFDPSKTKKGSRKDLVQEIYDLSTFLERESRALLREGRLHLGIDQRFWHIFSKFASRVEKLKRKRNSGE